jgi:hypothetical protein
MGRYGVCEPLFRKPAMRRGGSASRDDDADLRYAKLKPR